MEGVESLASLRVLMAHVPSPGDSFALAPAGARDRLRRVAAVLAHVCGLTLHMKRYIEKSRAKEWALFYLSIKNHSANELLFGINNYSKYNLSKGFEKLKTLLLIQPNQRSQEYLREIQLYLKKNRAFHSLPKEVQLQLCQTAIYQEFEAGSMLLRQGHIPLECYLILAGRLKVMSSNTSMNRNNNSEILCEFEEGDFIGEICLLTNANRPASFICKTDVKVLVISKEFYSRLKLQPDSTRVAVACLTACSAVLTLIEERKLIDLSKLFKARSLSAGELTPRVPDPKTSTLNHMVSCLSNFQGVMQ